MERGGADKTPENQGYVCVCVCHYVKKKKKLQMWCLNFAVKNMVITFEVLWI